MIAVYPFSIPDQDLALKNARWFNELGGCRGHEVLVCYDERCNPQTVEAVGQEMLKCFDKVYRLTATSAIDGWPEGANYFFRLVNAWMQGKKYPHFFWLEPDAIPLKRGWMDMIVGEHQQSGKPFMGDRVQVGDIPLHMSGVGIYPNPLHQFAGEAYRAHDTAWDMAGKDQIIPQAHWTKLIEHAWKHPKFTSNDELQTQISPECILFHSSKDGSLIDLLRNQKETAVPVLAEPQMRSLDQNDSGETRESNKARSDTSESLDKSSDSRGGSQPFTCDIFIRTYPGDYQWLDYCLQSIAKFCTGFRKVWIITPDQNPAIHSYDKYTLGGKLDVTWKSMNDETEDGYLAQQITKLYADVITDYQSDYILHVDSDVIFTRPCTPRNFFYQYEAYPFTVKSDKLIWYFTPYSEIQTPWQPMMEKFMTFHQPYEFMRRFPMMMPRWIYPRIREFCHRVHGQIISEYIRMQPTRAFSEFNALGCYAYFHHKEAFEWINTLNGMPEAYAKQYHSWSGISPAIKVEIEGILSGTGRPLGGDSPAHTHTGKSSDAPVPSQVKVLPDGTWVLEGDQISQWVEQEGRLDHDQNLLPHILKHIKPGDCVVDAGAFIGDHTVAYSDAVGENGKVFAYEPNPTAFQCLKHNTINRMNVYGFQHGLGDRKDEVNLSGNNNNYGGCYVGDHMPVGRVSLRPLDEDISLFGQVDLIKLDVEGYEVKALIGMHRILERFHPTMVIEVNSGALGRQGHTVGQLYAMLENHGYETEIIQKNCCMDSPLYDILAKRKSPEVSNLVNGNGGLTRCTDMPPPVVTLSDFQQIRQHVGKLKEFSESSWRNKGEVMRCLVAAGLKKPNPKNKKKHASPQVHTQETAIQSGKAGSVPAIKRKRPGGRKKLVQAEGAPQEN